MVNGQLSMVIGHWSLVIFTVIVHWSMVYGHWSLVYGLWSMVYGQWSMVILMGNGKWGMEEENEPDFE